MPIHPGDILDAKYEIKNLLGEGGMGAVYLAENTLISRKVAIKVLHAQYASESQVVARFHREARTASMIGHDNIIEILDLGQTPEGSPYIVMELLEGQPLNDVIDGDNGMDMGRAADIIGQVLSALQAAHNKGIIHRDMKPDNVYLTTMAGRADFVKVLDFGISKFHDATSSEGMNLTRTGMVLGTPVYMAPEQAEGRADLDHRADIFSTGAMLYQMLTGHLPFQAQSLQELLRKLLLEEPTDPRTYRPDLPDDMCHILKKALSRDRESRIQSANEFLDLLIPFGARRSVFAESPLVSIPPAAVKAGVHSTKMGWSESRKTSGALKTVLYIAAVSIVAAGTTAVFLLTKKPSPRTSVPLPPPSASVAAVKTSPEPSSPAPASPAALTRTEPEKVRIGISNLPADAKVLLDGHPVQGLPLMLDPSQEPHILSVEAAGFEPFEKAFVPNANLEIAVMMQPAPEPAKTGTAPSRQKRASAPTKKTTAPVPAPEPEPPAPAKTADKKDDGKGYKGAKQIQLQRDYPED